jgi:glucoamylase
MLSPARVHWSIDDWSTAHDTDTRDTGLGIHVLDLPTASLPVGGRAVFTFFWPEKNRWEGTDYRVTVEA